MVLVTRLDIKLIGYGSSSSHGLAQIFFFSSFILIMCPKFTYKSMPLIVSEGKKVPCAAHDTDTVIGPIIPMTM